MSLFRTLAHGIKVGAIGPTKGLCEKPQDLYVGCKNNGVPSYICTGGGGYNSKEKACGHVSVDCPYLQDGSPTLCTGVVPGPPTPPPSNDPTKYCICRKSICGDDNDCAPKMDIYQKSNLKSCCEGDQDCLNYAEDDISTFHKNPCGPQPPSGGGGYEPQHPSGSGGYEPQPPSGSGGYEPQHPSGSGGYEPQPPSGGGGYCEQEDHGHDNWTDQDKNCLYQSLTSDPYSMQPNIANCIVKNIVEKYTLRQMINLTKSGSQGDKQEIVRQCKLHSNFDGHYTKEGKKSGGLSVGAWIAIGVAIVVVLGLIGFAVYKKQGTHHTGRNSLTRVAI